MPVPVRRSSRTCANLPTRQTTLAPNFDKSNSYHFSAFYAPFTNAYHIFSYFYEICKTKVIIGRKLCEKSFVRKEKPDDEKLKLKVLQVKYYGCLCLEYRARLSFHPTMYHTDSHITFPYLAYFICIF